MKKLLAIPLCFVLFTACHDYGEPESADWATDRADNGEFEEDMEFEIPVTLHNTFGVQTVLNGAFVNEWAVGDQSGNDFATTDNFQVDKQLARQEAQKEFAKKIIRTANMRAEVDDYHQFRSDLAQALHEAEAFVSNENETSLKYSIEGVITVKVPAANFDALVSGISGLAPKWSKKDIHSKDVSDEYYDLQTRIGTKEEMEKQYLEILKKAKTIEEILLVQGHLRLIRRKPVTG